MLDHIYTYEGPIVSKLVKIFAEFDKNSQTPDKSHYDEIYKIAWIDDKYVSTAVFTILFKHYPLTVISPFLAYLNERGALQNVEFGRYLPDIRCNPHAREIQALIAYYGHRHGALGDSA